MVTKTSRVPRALFLLGTLAILATTFVIRAPAAEGATPAALPPGITDARVPVGDYPGVLYIAQRLPTEVPLRDFRVATGSGSPSSLSILNATAWVGTTATDVGARVTMNSARDAQLADQLLAGFPGGVWHTRQGSVVSLLTGGFASIPNDQIALQYGNLVSLQEKDQAGWDLLQGLPSNPTNPPVAAGYFRMNGTLIDDLAHRANMNVGGLVSGLHQARVKEIAFALYSNAQFTVNSTLQHNGAVVLATTKIGYPRFVVSLFFGRAMGSAGFKRVSVQGMDVYSQVLSGAQLLVRRQGNVIYLAVAADQATAADALARIK